jgi:hypothetical protein
MKSPSLFTVYAVLRSIDKGTSHERRISHVNAFTPDLRNWQSLHNYLELLLELGWIESFERQESTRYNYVKTGPLRHWKTRWVRLSSLGKEFLSLFPKGLPVPQQVDYDDEKDLPSPEEQARNWELFKRGEWNLASEDI